ncbi:MAG: 16S rRNA (guanine(966)-N(2))-methyltransferase RsmD [Sciscionella sp.]
MTRIVAGSVGGRTLRVPPTGTSPTSERVREALVNALTAAGELDGARVLDLYAGSGALGLEALSSGATEAVFVESDRAAENVLRQNIRTLGLPGALPRPARVRTLLESGADAPFDIVLADPPYSLTPNELDAVLAALAHGGWTAPGSTVVLERAARDGAPHWPAPLAALRDRRYGDTTLYWARHEAVPPEPAR